MEDHLANPKFDPSVYVALREQGLNNYEVAERLGVSEASVRRGLAKAGYKPYLLPSRFIEDMELLLEQPIVIDSREAGPGAVTADWHHPLTDYELVNRFIDHAVEIGATNWLAVGGDWFNQDFWSQYDYKQPGADVPRELRASSATMARLLDVFPEVYLTFGNHDNRLHKVLKYAVEFSKTMSWLFSDLPDDYRKRIKISNLDHLIIESAQGPYYLAHPAAYNTKPLTTAIDLAAKELKHVITAHSHHTAIGHDRSGQFVVAEIGGFFAPWKTQYLKRTTKYPKWQQGYGFIDRDGYLVVEGQGWSSRVGRRA